MFAFFSLKIKTLYWVLIFLIIAIVAAIFGFTGISTAAAGIAKILFFIFIFKLLPTELNVKIAGLTGICEIYNETELEAIASQNFGRPATNAK